MYCAYCGTDHADSVKFIPGHVVPHALGGPNAFTIRVCANSDNNLGGRVEKPFIEMFPVRGQRFFLGLSGTDGTEPTLDLGGEAQVNGHRVRIDYTIGKEGKQLRIVTPKIDKRPTEGGEHWTVFGDPQKVEEILEGKLRSLNAKHKKMKSDAGDVLTRENLASFLKPARVECSRPSIVKRVDIDLLACFQFFVKMALSVGHFVLGEPFSRSDGAQTLRAAMYATDRETAKVPRAFIWPHTDGTEQLFAPFRIKSSHVIGVLFGEPPIFIASLFGEYDAFIPLAPVESGKAPRLSDQGRIFQIELPSRRLYDRTLSDYLAAYLAVGRGEWDQSRN